MLQGKSGKGDLAGVVTSACICAFTGLQHSDYSNEVFATTGGKKKVRNLNMNVT